jgi:hypothetical protein
MLCHASIRSGRKEHLTNFPPYQLYWSVAKRTLSLLVSQDCFLITCKNSGETHCARSPSAFLAVLCMSLAFTARCSRCKSVVLSLITAWGTVIFPHVSLNIYDAEKCLRCIIKLIDPSEFCASDVNKNICATTHRVNFGLNVTQNLSSNSSCRCTVPHFLETVSVRIKDAVRGGVGVVVPTPHRCVY